MGPCLDDLITARFVDGDVPDEQRAEIELHLADCSGCRELVAVLAKANRSSEVGGAPLQSPLTLAPGARVGRYEVVEIIGAGGMGVVYAARDPELRRKIALKVVRSPEPAAHTRLLREGQAMARLSHPNVVTVHDVIAQEGEVVIAMELVPGNTLARWLQTKREWTAIADIFIQAGRGLAAAHAAGLVHRDFKPANVFVRDDGRVQVGDFGLARKAGDTPLPAAHESGSLSAMVTRAGAVVGTPHYMAPEQKSGSADGRSDQYSFCVALLEALDGQAEIAEITKIAERGSAEDRELRYPSIDALVGALEAARSPVAPRSRSWVVPGVAAVLALAIGGLLILRPSSEPPPEAPVVVAMLPFVDHTGQPALELMRGGLPRLLGTELQQAKVPVLGYYELREHAPATDPADLVTWRDRARSLGATLAASGTLVGNGDHVVVTIVLARVDGIVVGIWTAHGTPTEIPSVVAAKAGSLIAAASLGKLSATVTSPRALALERDVDRGIEAFTQLRLAEARVLFEGVLRQEPARPDALYYLGLTEWWQNESRDALEAIYKRALDTTMIPEHKGVLGGLVALVGDDFDTAIAEFRRLADHYVASTQIRYALSEALFHGGHPAEGIAVYRLLVEEVPGWHLALLHPLTYYSVHGNEEGMTWALARLPLLDPAAVKVWQVRRQIMRGELREASTTARALRDAAKTRDFDHEVAFTAIVLDDTAMLDELAKTQPSRAALAIALLRGDLAKVRAEIDVEVRVEDRRLRYNLTQLAPLVAISGDRELADRHLRALDAAIGGRRAGVNEQLARVFLLAALGRTQDIVRTTTSVPEVSAVVGAFAANFDGKPATEAWQRAFEASADGLFVVAGRHFLAAAQAAAADHRGVLETCGAILGPRYVDLAVAPAIPGCLARTGAAYEALGDHAHATEAFTRLGKLRGTKR